ncbi:MAG TPA: 2-hydroxyacid dehydrogenase [Streptosporangiaceae bacterium]|nr:2-hydroxyacid dehydrogenase [Streptosporangiaceae bacterium]
MVSQHRIGTQASLLVWVPIPAVASALDGIDGITVEVVDPDAIDSDGAELPASAAKVEIYVPPLFPRPPAIAALAAMPNLRVVQTLTAGIDLLLPHLPAGAVLCNARGMHDVSTAEWVVTVMLATTRKIPFFLGESIAGRWTPAFAHSLAGQTVLIVGHGSIGQAVERRLAGFEVDIVRVARTARDGVHSVADLPALLPQADVVVLLAPVTPTTIGMVDASFLGAMKDGALLVNGARGTLVRTDDLVAELASGRLFAALDVTDPEPLPSDHPLWNLPNALITPHAAATTWRSAGDVLGFLREQILRQIGSDPLLNVITGEY